MNSSLNYVIIFSIICLIVLYVLMKMIQARKEESQNKHLKNVVKEDYSIKELIDYVNTKFIDMTNSNLYEENLTEDEFHRKTRRRKELKQALKNCNTGDIASKKYVKEYIYELLKNDKKINAELINFAIPFKTPDLMSAREKFETLLCAGSEEFGSKTLGVLIEHYKLNEARKDGGYRILATDIEQIYNDTFATIPSFEIQLRTLTQIIYSQYKGFGIIDEVRDMEIDGVSGGVSGMPDRKLTFMKSHKHFKRHVEEYGLASHLESAWMMYRGKTIHLSFLSFESEAELRRIVTNAYKFGYPGQLSESRPAIINEMSDGSRVTVMRPKLSESWAFFIRKKYESEKLSLNQLITQENSQLPIKLLSFLMKGQRTMAITGEQFTGKTTMLMALIEHINAALNLRIQETAFELNLRNLYPGRNILTFQETDTYTGQDGLDLQKKTDGNVTVLGEVATAPVAAWMIQAAQVASLFTLFTHHASTFSKLVFDIRNSLMKTRMFSDERSAEQQVVSVLEFDVHLIQNAQTGERVIERVTECIPIQHTQREFAAFNPNLTTEEKKDYLIDVATMYFEQQAQTQQFVENTIMRFENGRYIAVNSISEERLKAMRLKYTKEELKEFDEFIGSNWGA